MNKEIEIPEGYKARIEGNKVIIVPKESEDERIRKEMLDAMVDIVANSLYEPLCPRDKMLCWLKSLRPQPHWKPSEEQMEALNEAINEAADSSSIHLNSWRYNLLKEIKEKIK